MIKILRRAFPAVLAALIVLAAGCGQNNVVATVNGEQITKQQLADMVENVKQYYKSMGLNVDENKDEGIIKMINSMSLDQLITQTILLQEAKKAGIQISKADVDKEIARYKETMTEEKFKQTLAANGWTEPKFRDMLEKDMAITELQKKVVADVKPATEDRAREFYDRNKKEFVIPASYQVRHILLLTEGKEGDKAKIDLEARTKAMAVLEQIRQGGDFAELARQKSEDPATASQGGLYTFSPGEAVPEFEAAVKSLQPGEITREAVRTRYGYHIIKMEKITPEQQKPFAELREELLNRLNEEAKEEKWNKFLEEARQKSEIVNTLDKPGDKDTGGKNKGEK